MNRPLLLITIALLNIYAGAQAAAYDPKKPCARLIAAREAIAHKSIEELNAEYAIASSRFESSATREECSMLHARNCVISEMFLKGDYANEAEKANLAAEMQQNLNRMGNPLSPKESFELRSKMARINERLYELEKLNNK
jgi:hypothetical protein